MVDLERKRVKLVSLNDILKSKLLLAYLDMIRFHKLWVFRILTYEDMNMNSCFCYKLQQFLKSHSVGLMN